LDAVVKLEEYVEIPVDEREVPRFVRRKLQRARREGRTGLLAYALIPGGSTPPPWMWRLVFVREGRETLFSAGPALRQGRKWVDLAPGVHKLTFAVGGFGEVEFTKEFRLEPGKILIAGCRTAYSRLPGGKNSRPNRWYIGIVDGGL
jgi:hypothetical protein